MEITKILRNGHSKEDTLNMKLIVTPCNYNNEECKVSGQKRRRCGPLEESAQQKKYAGVSQKKIGTKIVVCMEVQNQVNGQKIILFLKL